MTRGPFLRPTTAVVLVSTINCMGGFGPGLLIIALAVLAALGYGVQQLVRRRRVPEDIRPAALSAGTASPAVALAPGSPPQVVTPGPPPPGGWAVEVRRLTKRFGARAAVDSVDLQVPRGSAFGYLGPNGAGKTTLIRVVLGLTRADGGTMSLLGVPVPAERGRALARMGAIVDEPRFHRHLTGRENLRILAAARGGDAHQRIGPALARTGMTERADDKVATYSMGMRQRLGLSACMLGDPQLLILDEPMNGLDPAGMQEMREMIRGLAAEGRAVMLSSHLLDEVERTCDTVAIVDQGKVIRQGPIRDLVEGVGARVEVQCSDPAAAARALGQRRIAADIAVTNDGLAIELTAGTAREQTAEINRRLVEAGISVYGLRQTNASLEDWFLSVTSRFGEEQ
jgi:ABC-2 type transport system ATP-binding protein